MKNLVLLLIAVFLFSNGFTQEKPIVIETKNPALGLTFSKTETTKENQNFSTTIIFMKDDKYPVEVKLFFKTYFNEDIIETWTEIIHQEKKPVLLSNFASSMLSFNERDYWLTQFHGISIM